MEQRSNPASGAHYPEVTIAIALVSFIWVVLVVAA